MPSQEPFDPVANARQLLNKQRDEWLRLTKAEEWSSWEVTMEPRDIDTWLRIVLRWRYQAALTLAWEHHYRAMLKEQLATQATGTTQKDKDAYVDNHPDYRQAVIRFRALEADLSLAEGVQRLLTLRYQNAIRGNDVLLTPEASRGND